MNILIVDDSLIEIQIQKKLLSQFSECSVVGFENPLEAYEWSKTNDIDIAIVDYMMPGMNGLEFLYKFRQLKDKDEIPVLIVTVAQDKNICYKALELGANDLLTKPVDIYEYLARMKNMITIRKHQKELVNRTEWLADEVRKATLTLTALIESLPEGIVFLDEQNRIVLTNPNGAKFLGLLNEDRKDEAITSIAGQSITSLLFSESRKRWHKFKIDNPQSRYFKVAAESIGREEYSGGTVLVIIDVTEETEMLNRVHLQERLAAVGQLAAGITHDFNNILTVISASAQLMLIDKNISQKTESRLNTINDQVTKAAKLIKQVLGLCRSSEAERSHIDLLPFIKETTKLLGRIMPENINVIVDCDAGASYDVSADPNRLQQMLTNLAVNARDAMPDGGILRFALSNFSQLKGGYVPFPHIGSGKWVVLSVSDTGKGIAPDILPRIFDPFFTTKEPGKGTGLGLSQVFSLINQHDGFIDVKSAVDKGTSFFIYLPALAEKEHILPDKIKEGTCYGNKEAVLVVEDNPGVLASYKNMLELLNYTPVIARDGCEALEVFKQYPGSIAAVLADIAMPNMDGISLYRELKNKRQEIKVILITGGVVADKLNDFMIKENLVCLEKPVMMNAMANHLNNLINNAAG